MNTFTQVHKKLLLALAIFGMVIPNGLFLYYLFFAPEVVNAAFANPIALVFMMEALLLMILLAWLIHIAGYRSPGWLAFIIMSLLGSMAFSVPAFLYFANRKPGRALGEQNADLAGSPDSA
jgi:uncharacterized PurR-regulated membrane protein YhhQ (DUF165 family)